MSVEATFHRMAWRRSRDLRDGICANDSRATYAARAGATFVRLPASRDLRQILLATLPAPQSWY